MKLILPATSINGLYYILISHSALDAATIFSAILLSAS